MNGEPTFPAGDWDDEPNDLDNGIPAGVWLEYDAAADWLAARGRSGAPGSPLPENISRRCSELILADVEAFESRVRDMAYARAMRRIDDAHE